VVFRERDDGTRAEEVGRGVPDVGTLEVAGARRGTPEEEGSASGAFIGKFF